MSMLVSTINEMDRVLVVQGGTQIKGCQLCKEQSYNVRSKGTQIERKTFYLQF